MICGTIMETGGLSKRLVRFANSLVGGITGSLGMVTVIACMFFGAVSGSAPATVAAIGSIMIPMMVSNGYNKYYATGLTCCAGGLGVIVPPSYPMVLYGVTCNVSVGKLFIAGLGPAFVVGGLLMLINYVMCKRWGIKGDTKLELKNIASSFWDAKWALIMPVIILGGIYGGLVTPTEAAVLSVLYALIYGLVTKEIKVNVLWTVLSKTVLTSAVVTFIISVAKTFGWILSKTRLPAIIGAAIMEVIPNKWVYLAVLMVLLFLVGCLMDTIPSILILAPILVPVGVQLGCNELHLGVLFCITLTVGFITPPFGINLFTAVSTTGESYTSVVKGVIPFMIVMIICVLICAFVAPIITFLPGFMMGT